MTETIDGAMLTPSERFELRSEIAWLLLRSKIRKWQRVGAVEDYLLTPIMLGQFRLYRRGGIPIGFVCWAWLSKSIEHDFLNEIRPLGPGDWHSGDRLWFVELVAPFGDARDIVRDIRRNVIARTHPTSAFRGSAGARERCSITIDRDHRWNIPREVRAGGHRVGVAA